MQLTIKEQRLDFIIDPEVIVHIPKSQGSIDWLGNSSFEIFFERGKPPLQGVKLNDTAFSIDLVKWPIGSPLNLIFPFSSDYIMYRNPSFLLPTSSS